MKLQIGSTTYDLDSIIKFRHRDITQRRKLAGEVQIGSTMYNLDSIFMLRHRDITLQRMVACENPTSAETCFLNLRGVTASEIAQLQLIGYDFVCLVLPDGRGMYMGNPENVEDKKEVYLEAAEGICLAAGAQAALRWRGHLSRPSYYVRMLVSSTRAV
jgi:hypothetical protein